MDADRFDTLARSLNAAGSRRRALAAFGGVVGLALSTFARDEAEAKKKCPPCKKRKQGKCKKKKPNGTPCPGGTCQGGRCVAASPPPPPCQGKAEGDPCGNGMKCSGGACATEPDCLAEGEPCSPGCCASTCVGLQPNFTCFLGDPGDPCREDAPCRRGTCVGFVCQ